MWFFRKKKEIVKEETVAETVIYFGTHTGNSQFLAKKLSRLLTEKEVPCSVESLAKVRASDLANQKKVMFVVSTYGEGEAPANAVDFVKSLGDAQDLSHLEYSVCALGDTSFEDYCATGRYIDNRLAELGAKAIVPRAECDVEFDKPASEWMQKVVEVVASAHSVTGKAGSLRQVKGLVASTSSATGEAGSAASKRRYKARLTNHYRLSDHLSTREVFHLEFESEEFDYKPGDSVGFIPADLFKNAEIKDRRPRYYSIASSPLEVKNGFHITVRTHDLGIISPGLNHLLQLGDEIEFIHLSSGSFSLDNSGESVILVAAGVGIAPFRSFIRHNAALHNQRKLWLLYGDRDSEIDYLYKDEWRDLLDRGALQRMDVAFSRSLNPRYVQDVLHECRRDVCEWIRNGASVYVCGSRSMGADVRSFFDELRQEEALDVEIPYFEELF